MVSSILPKFFCNDNPHPQSSLLSAIHLFTDGGCEPVNPGGYACWGWLAVDEAGQDFAQDCGCLGSGSGMTNNLAEYEAVIRTLTWAAQQDHQGPTVLFSDSQLVVQQISGVWGCYAPHLNPMRDRAAALVQTLSATLRWIPRSDNARADALVRQAYRNARREARHE